MNDISHNIANKNPDVIANRLMERAEYRDGLQEIVIGLIILTFAGMTGLPAVFKGPFSSNASFWGIILLMQIIGFGSQWAIKKVRKRFLIGKTGYVKLKPVNPKQVGKRLGITIGLAFVIAAPTAFAMFKVVIAIHRGGGVAHWGLFPPAGWVFVGMGTFGGALMFFRVRLLRYEIGGITMVAIGILLALSRVSLNAGLTILYCFAGLLALISGSVVFLHFLRQPAESGE
jgi:hypothetical protein